MQGRVAGHRRDHLDSVGVASASKIAIMSFELQLFQLSGSPLTHLPMTLPGHALLAAVAVLVRISLRFFQSPTLSSFCYARFDSLYILHLPNSAA